MTCSRCGNPVWEEVDIDGRYDWVCIAGHRVAQVSPEILEERKNEETLLRKQGFRLLPDGRGKYGRPKAVMDENDPRHGTFTGYFSQSCRCAPCTEAATVYMRAQWEKRKERNRAAREASNSGDLRSDVSG